MSAGENEVTIYHNPRCSKSRQTLALLEEQGIKPTIVEYLKMPPAPEEIASILTLLGKEPRELMRRKEAAYAENSLEDAALDNTALIKAMHDNPVLIERPIVLANGKAAVGRPPEDVLKILS
ncbi:MAG: arsenate reductase (glutaredoxin) [Alphaproteobacteria bacterium]|jgi:arsenate reductase (glutaredoxin)|nr:arsenate reductase (glutaredoxin) [Alphaproteobacteria bacterium]MBT4018493.1 arsenate reductase (glutaredoxin) [Alphaproteobacteria bacterium]MBT5158946.1 arsenate reductase (glutaredoxin) [Alphaproteobacteria bacterium]MBT6387298.1 arsenate reductase (glutaredoxin) [Alphaproteobacteria bacterium]MBT7746050.1 arsenate reductase (glutaredoxin) [Alphaproteobacteria bacterium]